MPVYRYKLDDPTLARLSSEVPGSPTAGDLAPAIFIDVTLSNPAYKADLDDAMLAKGYSYLSTDPTTTPAQQANSEPGIAGPYTGVSREVRVASTVDVPTISGLLTIDTITVSAGDRVLLKNQNTGSQNGVYVADSGAWSYASDWATGAVVPEMIVLVSEGSANQHTKWRLTNQGTITVGSTALTFSNDTGGTDADAIHKSVANEISTITEKTTPVSADLLLIEDSAASGVKKRVQVGNLPSSGTPSAPMASGAHMLVDAEGAYDEPFFPGIPSHGKHWPWNCKVLTVDKSGCAEFTTIGAAIANATDGDVIMIAPGAYPEQITIDKTLSIIGLAPSTYSWDSSAVVLNPTITLGQAAITLTSNAGLSVFQNLRVASQHQTGALDSYGVLIQSMAGSTTYWDNCVIGPEIISGVSPTSRVRSVWLQTNCIADFRDCQLAVDDPSNLVTEVPPVVIIGNSTLRLLNTRVKNGLNTPGDVSIQDTAKLELVASIIEGTLDEGGTNNTTTYIDAASRINAVSADYTDTDLQTKLVHREYGLVDTGGQRDQYKLNLRNLAGDPSSPGDGDLSYSTVNHKYRVRENSVIKNLRSVWDSSKFLTVDAAGGADYNTIQAAINAASIDSDTNILIAPGTYAEQLTLKSGVNLVGLPATAEVSVSSNRIPVPKIKVTSGSSATMLTFSSGVSGSLVRISNLEIELEGTGSTGTYYLLDLTGSTSCAVEFRYCHLKFNYLNSGGTATCAAVAGTGSSVFVFLQSTNVIATATFFASGTWANNSAWSIASTGRVEATLGRFTAPTGKTSFYAASGANLLLYQTLSIGLVERVSGSVVTLYGGVGLSAITGEPDDGTGASLVDYGKYLTNGTKAMQKLTLRAIAGDVPTPSDGNVWYNSSVGKIFARQGGATAPICSGCPGPGMHMLADGGASEDGPPGPPGPQGPQGPAGGTGAGGANTQVQYNNGGVLAGDADLVWDSANNVLALGASAPAVAASQEMTVGTNPVTPAANKLRLYARLTANRVFPRAIGPSGVDYPLQASFFAQQISMAMPGTGTGLTFKGMGSTNAGTVSHPTLATTNFMTAIRRARFASSTTAGSFAGLRGTRQDVWRGNAAGLGGFFFSCRFAMTTNLANVRAFVGLNGNTAALANADPSGLTTDLIGMYLNSASTNWGMLTNDNAGAGTTTDLGASYVKSTTTVYDLRMWCAPNAADIYWEASIPATGTTTTGTFLNTNLPRNTIFLNPYIWITNNATAAAAQIEFASLYLESDY